MYNYLINMVEDVKEAIRYNNELTLEDLEYNKDRLQEKLYDDLWIDDSVTGNGSGSYFFSTYKSKEAVQDNMKLCKEALEEFCVDPKEIGERFLNEDWEYLDVTIRCYLLGQAIEEALEEIQEELEEVEG